MQSMGISSFQTLNVLVCFWVGEGYGWVMKSVLFIFVNPDFILFYFFTSDNSTLVSFSI